MQELIERFRDLAYETGWLAGKAEAGGEVDAEYQKGKIAERGQAANAILVRHEEECRACARRSQEAVLPCGHHASNAVVGEDGKVRCEMCELQAQVAMMAEALSDAKRFMLEGHIPPKPYGVIQRIDKALSVAPKMVWHKQGRITQFKAWSQRPPECWVELAPDFENDSPLGLPPGTGVDGQQVNMIVMDCSVKEGCLRAGEQA